MQVNIEPDDIQQAIVDAVIASTLGEAIKSVIQKELDDLCQHREGAIKKAIRLEIQKIVLFVIRDEYGEVIRAAVREELSDRLVTEIASKALEAVWDKL